MVEDTLSLIAHFLMEIRFYISFILSTFFYQIHRLRDIESFLDFGFSKICKPHVLRDCCGNIRTLTNNYVTSVFVKMYRRVYWTVKVKKKINKCSNCEIRFRIFEKYKINVQFRIG